MSENTSQNEQNISNTSGTFLNSNCRKIIKTNNLRKLMKSLVKVSKENQEAEKEKKDVSENQKLHETKETINLESNVKDEKPKIEKAEIECKKQIPVDNQSVNNPQGCELSKRPKINCFGKISILKKLKLNIDLNEVKKNVSEFVTRNIKLNGEQEKKLTDNNDKIMNPNSKNKEGNENNKEEDQSLNDENNKEEDQSLKDENNKEEDQSLNDENNKEEVQSLKDENNKKEDQSLNDENSSVLVLSKETDHVNDEMKKNEDLKLICEIEISEKDNNLSCTKNNSLQESKEMLEKTENSILIKKNSFKKLEDKSIRAGFSFYKESSNKMKQSLTNDRILKAQINRRILRNSISFLNESIRGLSTSTFTESKMNHSNSFDPLNNSDLEVYDRALKSLENIDSNLNDNNDKKNESCAKEESKSQIPSHDCVEYTNDSFDKREKDIAIVEKNIIEESKVIETQIDVSEGKETENINKRENDSLVLLDPEPKIISNKINTNYNLHRRSKSNNLSTTNPFNILSFDDEKVQNEISINDSIDDSDKNIDNINQNILSKQISLNNDYLQKDQESVEKKNYEMNNATRLSLEKLLGFFDLFLNVYRKINHRISCHFMCNQFILNFYKLSNIEQLLDYVPDENERNVLNEFFIVLEIFMIIAYDFSQEGLIYDIHISYLIDIVKKISKVFLNFLNLIIVKNECLNKTDCIKFFEDSINKKLKKQIEFAFNLVPESVIYSMRTSIFNINEAIKIIVLKHPNNFLRNLLNQYFSNQVTIDTKYLNEFYLKNICFEFEYGNHEYLGLIDSKSESSSLIDLKKKIPCFRTKLNIKTPFKEDANRKSAQEAKDLAQKASEKRFALVLDLDETLIHFEFSNKNLSNNNDFYYTDGVIHIRPGLNEFLECLKDYYELIVFTLGTQGYADPILDKIENGSSIFAQRLYRSNATIFKMDFAKDLSNLGRDLSKITLVDNLESNFAMQKENGILIKSYHGYDLEDKSLFELRDILKEIALSEENDIRVAIKNRRDVIKEVVS